MGEKFFQTLKKPLISTFSLISAAFLICYGAPAGTRTLNLRIRSALLYPIELIALIQFTTLIIIH